MHSENLIWQFISRTLTGEASQEEITVLNEALQKDESLQQRYEILKQFWHCAHSSAISENEENENRIAEIFEKANINISNNNIAFVRKRRHRKRSRVFFGSLAIIAISFASWFFYKPFAPVPTTAKIQAKLNQLVAQNGSRNRSILPDGSIVWLNAGSSLSYETDFKGPTREVYLKGEAFFDVVKDSKHPFIVHANSVDIKVLGTAFNVKSYLDDNKVEATLIRGVIQVTRQDKTAQKPVFLHPNEKLVINLAEIALPAKVKTEHLATAPITFKVLELDSAIKKEDLIETSWMYNRLEFRGDSFGELAKKLERWYNVKIIFEDDAVKQLSFNGSFENETAEQAFAALKTAVQFDYTIKEHEIFVRSVNTTLP